ncbi:hypothetical protein YC2023_119858 [Brassica napus]
MGSAVEEIKNSRACLLVSQHVLPKISHFSSQPNYSSRADYHHLLVATSFLIVLFKESLRNNKDLIYTTNCSLRNIILLEIGLSAGVGVVALLGSIHRRRSVQGLNRYRRMLAPGLRGGSRAEGPNPPPGGHESDICGFGGIRDPIHFVRVINHPN